LAAGHSVNSIVDENDGDVFSPVCGGERFRQADGRQVSVPLVAAFCITMCSSLLLTAAVLLFPRQVFGIFTDEAEVLAIAMEYVPVAVLLFLSSACRAPMNALINGSGDYRVNFATAILDGLVMRIGLALLFGLGLHMQYMQYMGFWLGDALAGFTPFGIGLAYYFSGSWKKQHPLRE